jgi:2-polyprenyl-6-methoxyphenol hydroxylase-like FAD-dependent oxidoreductase
MGGLCSALLLGRAGHEVTVCERDPAQVPEGVEETWSEWPRPGIPQARLGHAFFAGFRRQMRERLPDVLDTILADGVPRLDTTETWMMPAAPRRAEDDELCMLLARRPVIDAALRRAAEAEPTVQVLAGCHVAGLVADSVSSGEVPKVTGVRTATGGIAADLVVIAGGRTVPVGRWFQSIGAAAPSEQAEGCGFSCYTRYFRPLDVDDQRLTGELLTIREPGYLVCAIAGADNGTFCVEIAVPVSDQPMKRLRDVTVWTAAAMALPGLEEWITPQRSEPISPAVEVMGQERNTLRWFTKNDRPLALGVHVIGDARCQTDSLFAWGCGDALMGAAALADAIAEHADDDDAQALALAGAVDAEIEGRYAYSVARDRAHERVRHGKPKWDTMESGIGLIDGVLLRAADLDADVYRAFYRWELQLDPANHLEAQRDVVERARALLGSDATTEPALDTDGIPTREQLVEAMATVG